MSLTSPLFRLSLNAALSFPSPSPPPSLSPSYPSTETWSKTPHPSHSLTLLPPSERASILRYLRPSDAALALSSALLKHYLIARAAHTPWSRTHIISNRAIQNGKPFYAPTPPTPATATPADEQQPRGAVFNVSHHGDMVVIIGGLAVPSTAVPHTPKVGIDIVRIERDKAAARIAKEKGGFEAWVRMFADVLAPAELRRILRAGEDISAQTRDGASAPQRAVGGGAAGGVETGLRTFYAYWALKEAYAKMTGEGLLADWLKELEFRNVNVPGKGERGGWGQAVGDVEVWLRGERVDGVRVELIGLGDDYVVATAVEGGDLEPFAAFEELDLVRDIWSIAEPHQDS